MTDLFARNIQWKRARLSLNCSKCEVGIRPVHPTTVRHVAKVRKASLALKMAEVVFGAQFSCCCQWGHSYDLICGVTAVQVPQSRVAHRVLPLV